MIIQTLNGTWQLVQIGKQQSIPATVPGCVHIDLLAANQIPDPFYRDNELAVLWVGEADWQYHRIFTVAAELLAHKHILLRCAGLDTLATISLNGHFVAEADNMFRSWEFDIKPFLRPGENEIRITFASAVRYAEQQLSEHNLPHWNNGEKIPGANSIRKAQYQFGWDWGPRLVTCGIWRDVELLAFNSARLTEIEIRQDHKQTSEVTLSYYISIEGMDDTLLTAVTTLTLDGKAIATQKTIISDVTAVANFTITDPQLWWPNGLGEQPLYDLHVTLKDEHDQILDSQHKRVGLRTLRLDRHTDQWGESFQFVVNGVPFFAKGANWIPADSFVTRLRDEQYRGLLADTAVANMNMLRVWGGGIYEQDIFYDLCDELGLCVWQDFMFACATYATFDNIFMANVAAEARDNIKRLRHHPSIALWCGNNELEQGLIAKEWTNSTMSWVDYGLLFDQLLPQIVAELAPDTDYWPSSPHSPLGERTHWNNPQFGDAHIWDVWHGKEPFEFYRTCHHRFNSEFGFQSFPEPQTVAEITTAADQNITSYVMEHHQRSGIGNQTIIHYMLDWFRLPNSFDMTLWLSQIGQGMAMKYAVEHWRRSMPRGMGTLYWQLNDCWPVASWSSIDSLGRWKALHYMARHFYAPLLISGVEDVTNGNVEIHVTNDHLQAVEAEACWELMTVDGTVVDQGRFPHTLSPNANNHLRTLNIQPQLQQYGPRNLLLWLTLHVNGVVVTDNLVHFARPKHLELADPQINMQWTKNDAGVTLTITAQMPALWTWLSLPDRAVRFTDNFFHLQPGRAHVVALETAVDMPTLQQNLRIYTLRSTY